MRISKKRIKRIVLEEQYKLLREWGAANREAPSPLIEFAQAWAGLGDAVQVQVMDLLDAYIQGAHEPEWTEVVYEQNPNAIDMAWDRLARPLRNMESYGDSTDLLDALEEAVAIYRQGDAEVEADARAAGDIP